ncbi:TM1802 family CRISPR-associated protein [Peptococcaceae bacterium 1198_IL3148]
MEGGISPQAILSQISDVAAVTAKGFLSRVFVIEVDKRALKTKIAALPLQCWGDYEVQSPKSKKQVFVQDVDRAVGAPFVIPAGGNPTKPQGRYSVPSYLTYEKQVQEFISSASSIEKFLAGRVPRTVGVSLTDKEITEIANQLHKVAQGVSTDTKDKLLALVVLAVVAEDSPYQLSDQIPRGNSTLAYIGPSVIEEGKYLVADLNLIKDRFWEAKLAEGAEKGERQDNDAICYFCGAAGRVVSTYCKAWPWFTTTWSCPLPAGLKDNKLVETIAVCPQCYNALTYGANLFNKLTKPLDNWLTKELFAPSATAEGKRISKIGTPERIYGCGYVLPVLDDFLEDEDDRLDFVEGMLSMLTGNETKDDKVNVHLQEITGFELQLPQEISADNYRLTIIYYSGDTSRGDIHLRATIEEVIPSVAKNLKRITKDVADYALDIANQLQNVSVEYAYIIKKNYSSLPYLLTNAYGAPYIWQTLSNVLHRGKISRQRFLLNIAQRMNELARKLPDSNVIYDLNKEVIFYLAFTEFLIKYQKLVAVETGNGGSQMRDWRELKTIIAAADINDIKFIDAEELGFACGYLMRVFSKHYWHKSNGKDFLKHRVMTFGSSLTPESIWKRGLSKVDEYARKLDMHITDDLRKRFALALMEYSRMKEQVNKDKDAFMAAFWAGYALATDKKNPR